MLDGIGITAYLVNESRARRPDLARDHLAVAWIPDAEQAAVRALWEDFARAVYAHDDLVVSLRGRYVLDVLAHALRRDPDTVLVVCGAGFSSYPWLLPFRHGVEIDLPELVEAKQRRAAQLRAAGVIDERDVIHLAADLADENDRQQTIDRVQGLAAGRRVALVAEGLVFYLSAAAARAVTGLGSAVGSGTLTVLSYWPDGSADHPVLAAQRHWFRLHAVPDEATYLTDGDLREALGRGVDTRGPEQLQHEYLGGVLVPESDLIPEYMAVALP